MNDFSLAGGCQCGAVRYRVTMPATETVHCHCSMCRKVHGTMFVTFSQVPDEGFQIDRGADKLGVFESTPGNGRYFCKTCSAVIYTKMPNSPVTYFSTGTLDEGAHPGHPEGKESHMFWASRAPWLTLGDDLPKADEY